VALGQLLASSEVRAPHGHAAAAPRLTFCSKFAARCRPLAACAHCLLIWSRLCWAGCARWAAHCGSCSVAWKHDASSKCVGHGMGVE